MRRILIATALLLGAFSAGESSAQSQTCPPEVASAKAILTARGGEMQASRTQDAMPVRDRAAQAGPSRDYHSSDTKKAEVLVREAEAACRAGDPALASEKAMAALDLLKR